MKPKKLLFAPWAAENEVWSSYQYWYAPLKKIFKKVIFFDPQKILNHFGKDEMNRKFLEIIKKEKPDYVFLWLIFDEFSLETLANVKKISPKTKLINFFGDDDTRIDIYTLYYALFIDYNFILPNFSIKEYRKRGIKNVFFTCGTNLKHFKPLNLEKKYDVTFIGSAKPSRYALVTYLKANGINITLFGSGWGEYPKLKDVYKGQLSREEYINVINQSRINLGLTQNDFGQTHLVGRIFEIGACKSFILIENTPRFFDFFKKNKEIIAFNNKIDLLKKIKYYLKHEKEREKIAEATYKKVLKNYDVDKELKIIFKKIFKDEKKRKQWKLPKINKRIAKITEQDIRLSSRELNSRLKHVDYVYFEKGWCRSTGLRKYISAYALRKFGKEISCCDYYVYSKSLGDYLLFWSHKAFNELDKKEFDSLLDINQLMITKDYFIKNLNKFKEFFEGKDIDLINEETTAFISVPLVQISRLRTLEYKKMKNVFFMKFFMNLSRLAYEKRLSSDSYLYKLILESFLGKPFILRYLFDSLMNTDKLKTFKKYLKN